MRTSQKGIELIKSFEELRTKVYLDPVGIPTIGWGHTKDVTLDAPEATVEQCENWLREDLQPVEKAINLYVEPKLNQNQFDALASFVFNVGVGNFKVSTLLRKINEQNFVGAAQEFGRWVYAKGKKLPGLERRRRAEAELWLS